MEDAREFGQPRSTLAFAQCTRPGSWQEQGYGEGYRYAHDESERLRRRRETYFPEALAGSSVLSSRLNAWTRD